MHFKIMFYCVIVITVIFDQSAYIVDEDNGPVQPVLVLSNPSTVLIVVQVNSSDGSAVGKSHKYNLQCEYNNKYL